MRGSKTPSTRPGRCRKRKRRKSNPVLQHLVRYLTKDEPDPFLRVKNLHDWICDGYAGLFLRMADIAGFLR
jgi:hypothetical protein